MILTLRPLPGAVSRIPALMRGSMRETLVLVVGSMSCAPRRIPAVCPPREWPATAILVVSRRPARVGTEDSIWGR